MPRGRPEPLPPLRLRTLTQLLRGLHEEAQDPNEEQFPSLDDPYGWLEYALKHSKVLPDVAKKRSGETCILLARHLHRELDVLQLAGIRLARSAGARWEDLTSPMGVVSKGSAVKRAQRLEVEVTRDRDELRAPETLKARQQAEVAEQKALCGTQASARLLLAHRADLWTNEDIIEDMDYLQTLLEPKTQTQVAALGASLRELARSIRERAAAVGQPAGRTAEAQRALARAEQSSLKLLPSS